MEKSLSKLAEVGMRTKELFAFIKERHLIYERKAVGKSKPWTKDPILQKYRFCNVYRELDTQTQWLSENWRNDGKDFWFAALVFRFVNWGDTAVELSPVLPWDGDRFCSVLRDRKLAGEKVYSGAYMISTHGVRQPKNEYLANSLNKIWDARDSIRYKKGETLNTFHARLMNCFDVGSFIAGQVIADAKYAGEVRKAMDWWTFAASGPGSRRGLNRVFGAPVNQPWNEDHWRLQLLTLHQAIIPLTDKAKMPALHAQDLQNCLCEFDKYERTRLGEGRPRSTYKGV